MSTRHFRQFVMLCLFVGVATAVFLIMLNGQPRAQESGPPRTSLEFPPKYPLAEPSGNRQLNLQALTVLPATKVAFQSYRDANWNIYIGNDDGTNQTQVTSHIRSDIHPHLNRGATQVVYASKADDHDYELYKINVDGSQNTPLTNNSADDGNPMWSPDGSKIVFESYRDGQAEIYVMNADGSNQVRLTTHGDFDGMPTWSPDGSKIAFVSRRTGYRIWVMNADGSNQVQLSNQAVSLHPRWSPDGSMIAYDADGDNDGWQEVWLMNADGSDQHYEYSEYNDTDTWVGGWSPDGRYITFTNIHFVYYQGNWYWDAAYLDAWNYSHNSRFRLSYSGLDWYPHWQTGDGQPPVSQVQFLGSPSPAPIPVYWSGTDTGGSGGIRHYDVQVKTGANGPWTNWLMGTTATSAHYPGTGGNTYYFRVRAYDLYYTVESWPDTHDAVTTVENLPPQSYMNAPLPYSRYDDNPLITWGGDDYGGSGIATYDVQYRLNNGTWNDWLVNTAAKGANFDNGVGDSGDVIYFRVRATDRAQNHEEWPGPGGEVSSTLYRWGIQGTAFDNTNTPVSGISVLTNPPASGMIADDKDGRYGAYVVADAANYSAGWSKNEYGPLPSTLFAAGMDTNMNVWLPPAHNIVSNWDFEDGPAQSDWQLEGAVPPIITDFVKHTGHYGVMFGDRSLSLSPMEIIGDGFNQRIVVDAEGTIHMLWNQGTTMYYRYRLSGGDWSQIRLVSNDQYIIGELLADQFGNLHALGGIGFDNLYYYHYDKATGQWSMTTVVNDDGDWVYAPQLAVDSYGKAHVVWDFHRSGDWWGQAVYSYQLNDGTFSPPITFEDNFGRASEVKIAFDGQNQAHVTWISTNTNNVSKIMYVSGLHGNWPEPQDLTGVLNGSASAPLLSVALGGRVYIFWTKYLNGETNVYYKYREPIGVWSDVLPGPQVQYARIVTAVDGEGSMHLMWRNDNGAMFYTQKGPHSGWLPVESLADSETMPQMVVDKFNNVHLIWGGQVYGSTSEDIHHMQKVDGGTWTAPVNLSAGETAPSVPQITVDAGGGVHIAWTSQTSAEPYETEIHYRGPQYSSLNIDSVMRQEITVPLTITAPTLSFVSRLGGVFPQNESGFSLIIDDGSTQTDLQVFHDSSPVWNHTWADLTPWVGQTISVTFALHQVVGEPLTWMHLDEVSIGSAHPDVWVDVSNMNGAPGQQKMQRITYGNRGGAVADGMVMTYTLPAEMTFVSASIPPVSTNPLVWHLDDLPAKSDAYTLEVTVMIAPSAPGFTYLTTTAVINTADTELEHLNNQAEGRLYTAAFTYLPVIFR